MRNVAFTAIALLATFSPARGNAADNITGRASVVDGDTIDIGDVRIRFNGIDAPESWQRCKQSTRNAYRCGKEAAFALDSFLAASRPTTCRLIEKEAGHEGKRWIGECFRSDGAMVNRWLVRNGWALDWPKFSGGRYAADQAKAKARGVGIWRGSFTSPCVARAKRMKRAPNC
jgi:succinoglycan biosynthesis protein ExoI